MVKVRWVFEVKGDFGRGVGKSFLGCCKGLEFNSYFFPKSKQKGKGVSSLVSNFCGILGNLVLTFYQKVSKRVELLIFYFFKKVAKTKGGVKPPFKPP